MEKPLISIIVPIYKVEKYLDRCVESIVNQTYENLEIILVDDGSPDNCPAICDAWAEKDSRIKVIHKENGGLANARNSGIEICKGEYVQFTDGDDYLEPDMIEFLLSLATENGADVCRCGYYYDHNDGNITEETTDHDLHILSRDEAIAELATSGFAGTAWDKLYKKDIILSHRYEKIDGCSEDIMHNFRTYKDISQIVVCDIPKYHYCFNGGSITSGKFSKGAFDIIRAKKIILEYAKENTELLPYAIRGYVLSAFIVLSGCIKNNMFEDEKNELIKFILSYKSEIMSSPLYSKKDKLKTEILSLSPKLYEQIILRK